MPLIQIVIVLIVIGVLLWLVNLIPMQGTIKSILNAVVVICVVLWLLNVFGVLSYLPHIRVGLEDLRLGTNRLGRVIAEAR